ncbi:MAG: glycosyltransferase family A protein [Pyrinomonadaceae bacterium]
MHESLNDNKQIRSRALLERRGANVPKNPKVSVIVPAYKVAGLISDTLDSIFSQTGVEIEVILVNDGSPDTEDLEKAISGFSDRLVYLEQENMGAPGARNLALSFARGEFIAFLDGDDIWNPGYLESQLKKLTEDGLDLVYSNAEFIGDHYLSGATYMDQAPSNGSVNVESLIAGTCNAITSGLVLRYKVLEKVGLFDHDATPAEDFDLWLRIALAGFKLGYQREPRIKYRVSATGLSGTSLARSERAKMILSLVRDKYEFNADQKSLLASRIEEASAEIEIEKAKLSIVLHKYDDAKKHLALANRYHGKRKFSLIAGMLGVFPGAVRILYKFSRPKEFDFIEANIG